MNPSNIEYVAFAAYLLSAFEKPVDTEDVAIKAYEIAPERFCWKRYPEQINLAAVSKRLYDARLEKNGSLVDGSDKQGWILTQKGLCWAKGIASEFESVAKNTKSKNVRSSGIAGAVQSTERKRIAATKAYILYASGRINEIALRDAEHVYRFDDYVDARTRTLKINRALEIFANEAKMTEFLRVIEKIIEEGNTTK